MSSGAQSPPEPQLVCGKCGQTMVMGKVTVSYLENTFPIELLKCPGCGMAYVPEELATGKMLQVEQGLEDK